MLEAHGRVKRLRNSQATFGSPDSWLPPCLVHSATSTPAEHCVYVLQRLAAIAGEPVQPLSIAIFSNVPCAPRKCTVIGRPLGGFDGPPPYGTMKSAVPRKSIIEIGRDGLHGHSFSSIRSNAAGATAAKVSAMSQATLSDMPPPIE